MIMRSLLIIILGLYYYSGYAQIINFPDPNFKNALVNTKCVSTNGNSGGEIDSDLNNDGEIDVSEALMVMDLEIDSALIYNLDGLEYFKNLRFVCK